MNTGIYEIRNTVNGKRYIGSAVNFIKRWRFHRWSLNGGAHHNSRLQRSWTKYGEGAFRFRKVLICSKESLLMFEQSVIDGFRPQFNIAPTAGSSLGRQHSPETRAKIGASKIGHTFNRGRKHSVESRAKMSASRIGNTNCVGYKHSAETREKVSASAMGRKRSVEAQEKISYALRMFSPAEADEVRKGILSGISHRKLATLYSCSSSLISSVRNHKHGY